MLIDPRHLQILFAVVDAGGLSEGAARLGKSQPSLSRSIALLEARLGAPLFEKGRRPLRATPLGVSLAEEGRAIAEATKEAVKKARSHTRGHSGVIRLAGTPVFMDGVISPMLAAFQAEFPDLRIDQSYGYLDALLRDLERDQLDLAICPVIASELPATVGLDVLLPGRNVIACGANHPLARKSSLRLDDIAPYPWIAPPADSPLFRDLRQVLSGIGMDDIKVSFSGGSLASILNVLAGSDALTVLPYSVVFSLGRQVALHALPIKITHPERQLAVIRRQDISDKPAATNLTTHLKMHFVGLSRRIAERERQQVWRA
ncbi:LysR family transcriptional regulator [Roseobacteraceae bacterium S113]